MEEERSETVISIPTSTTVDDRTEDISPEVRDERQPTEEDRRVLLEKDMSDAREKGFRVCRLWQLLLTLNLTIILLTIALVFLLLFIIGPLAPYMTYGQSCRALSCNAAQGLVCNSQSICGCPSTNSYWSYNEGGCRRCPNSWSSIKGKCIFVSTFTLNWTDASTYCKSFTAQLLTLTATKMHSTMTLSDIANLVVSNTNYFLGLSEQPHDSGHWQWVDGSSIASSSMNLFCSNGSINQFDPIFRSYMYCGIYRMDSCLARSICQRIDRNFLCEKI